MSLEINLAGKRALVTGASDGLGKAIAITLAKAGCDVVGTGRVAPDHERALELLQHLEAQGHRSHYLEGDLSLKQTPAQHVADAVERLGGLDIVISNAGLNIFKGVESCSEEDWEYNIQLNLSSHWRLGQAALPELRKNKGVFQVMNSNHAYSTIAGCFPYQTSKTALLGLVQSCAIEWGPDVRVVGIAPGFIDTPGNQSWFDQFPNPEEEKRQTEQRHLTRSIGKAEDVGALCCYLASPYARFITGNTILMDGGRSAMMQDGHPFHS
ncbi:SDR family oxidoreductase [Verrucomicrobiaceae bacterium N1E253]|uniref:SDR family oxidoreductase n=1 Tax=Oceaniferula marina TaxID=2748318 RepID=A0A851GC06_9BACT|nr:SDR family oxidoreductase [Oceaniferula marina]NWK54956.1 SDR family oxidoreductase [Oceaniferula marina]